MICLAKFLKLGCRPSIVPELSRMSQDLKKSQRKGRELLALVVVELVDLLADELVGGQEHSQATVFMPPFF